MDETTKERQIDEKYEALKASLSKERQEFKESAEALESRSDALKEEVRKNIRELGKPITPQEMFLASMSSWALAQTFRLGERMTKELEWLYAAHYGHTKSLIALERYIPQSVKQNLDVAVAEYEAHIGNKILTDEQEAMLKFFYDYFMGDQT